MSKKFLFVAMVIAAGLVFGSCGKEEEQAEEVVEDVVEEVIDSVEVVEDTVVAEEVVEEVAAPAPKKATAKKKATTVKADEEGVKLETEKVAVKISGTETAAKSTDRAGAPKLQTKNTQIQVAGKKGNVTTNTDAAQQPTNTTVTISK